MAFFFFNSEIQNTGKLLTPSAFMDEAIENKSPGSFILIVPTKKQVRRYTNEFIRKYYYKNAMPVGNLRIYNFRDFVNKCFKKFLPANNFLQISDAYRLTLIEEAAKNAGLEFFSRGKAGFSNSVIEKLDSVIYGLKEDGILPENLNNDLENESENVKDKKRLKDIYKLYSEYQNILGGKYLDYPETISLLIKEIDETRAAGKSIIEEAYPERPSILLHGFSEFKNPEAGFLARFGESGLPVAINVDYDKTNGPLFGNLEDTKQILLDTGYRGEEIPFEEEKNKVLSENMKKDLFLRQNLFNAEAPISNDETSEQISIFAADDRDDEVESIARLVKYLNVVKGIALHDICISVRQPGIYTQLFRECFIKNGIPANISDRYSLDRSPVAIAIFSLLDTVIYGYKKDDIRKALNSAYLDFTKNDIPVNTSNLFRFAASLRIAGGLRRGGAKNWEYKLDAASKLYSGVILEDKGNFDEMKLRELKRTLKNIEQAARDFRRIKELISFENKKCSPAAFAEIIKNEIIKKFRISELIFNNYQILKNNKNNYTETEYIQLVEDCEKDAKALEAFIDLTDELAYILNDRYEGIEFTLADYAEKLKTAASAARFQIKEKHGYGVTITSIEQTRGIPYKALILSGAVDGELPIAYTPERFLGKELDESEDRHLRSERLQFYQFLTNAYDFDLEQKHYYIFYPKTDNEKELVLSPFINSLLLITSNTGIIDLSEARADNELKAKLPWLDAVISKPGIMEFTGKSAGNDIKTDVYENPLFSDDFKLLNKEAAAYVNDTTKGLILKGSVKDKEQEDVFSISRLENYASCPYKYFAESLLKLEKKEEEDTFLSAMDKGSILHEVLQLFYERLQQDIYGDEQDSNNKLRPVKLDPDKKDEYLELLKAIATRVIKLYEFDHPFFKLEKDDIFGRDGKQGILEFWLSEELKRIKEGWPLNPVLFEFSFGLPFDNRDPVEIGEGLKIRGKIDRIEIDNEQKEFLIADYKLSANSLKSHTDIKKGRAFQIPLYIKAAEHLLKEEYGINTVNKAAVYYNFSPAMDKGTPVSVYFQLATKEANFTEYKASKTTQFCKDDTEKAEIINKALDRALEIYQDINNGSFPVKPADKNVCLFCSFQPVCRIRSRDPFAGSLDAGDSETNA